METVESLIKEARREWEELKNNGIEDGDLLEVSLFAKADSKSKAKGFKKVIRKERGYSVDVRPQNGWIGMFIRVKPMRVDFDTIKELITWHVVNGAKHDCRVWSWSVKVPFKGQRKSPDAMKSLVDLQLALIRCPERKEALKRILITPREEGRTSWCVAEDEDSGTIIVYDVFTRHGADYPWGILETQAKGNVVDVDCLWHASLDDAFINSKLCPESLVPEDYEIP